MSKSGDFKNATVSFLSLSSKALTYPLWTYKIFTKWKLRVMFYSVGIFRMSNLRNSISSNPERTALRRWREELGYIEVLQQRRGSLNIKILLLKKTRYFKLRNLVFFCVWEDARVWAHRNKISFIFFSAIRASILCCSHPELPWCSP